MRRNPFFTVVSLALASTLAFALAACSDDVPPSVSDTGGGQRDQGLIYHDTTQAIYDTGPVVDTGPVADTGPSDTSPTDVSGNTDSPSAGDGNPPPTDLKLAKDLTIQPDGSMSCVANSFIGCQGTTLVRCSAQGKPVNISCSPYLCNVTYKRCDECAPRGKSACNGAYSVACGIDGRIAGRQDCSAGCDPATGFCTGCTPKTYYRDFDGDRFGDPKTSVTTCNTPPWGYVSKQGDCDDKDNRAHPGQTRYFTSPTKGNKDFDFDCDGKETMQWPNVQNCAKGCTQGGWQSTVPACGKTGNMMRCFGFGGTNCKAYPQGSQTQPCR